MASRRSTSTSTKEDSLIYKIGYPYQYYWAASKDTFGRVLVQMSVECALVIIAGGAAIIPYMLIVGAGLLALKLFLNRFEFLAISNVLTLFFSCYQGIGYLLSYFICEYLALYAYYKSGK